LINLNLFLDATLISEDQAERFVRLRRCRLAAVPVRQGLAAAAPSCSKRRPLPYDRGIGGGDGGDLLGRDEAGEKNVECARLVIV
jgi:hypothetical protein